jgi:hypothetical protein
MTLPWDSNVPQLGPEAQTSYIANILAQQTLAAAITRAWESAGPELREEFAKSLLSWCITYLQQHTLGGLNIAEKLVAEVFKEDLDTILSKPRRDELADAVAERMIYVMRDKKNMLTWEESEALKHGILAAARAELAAAGRELGVEAMAAKPESEP